MDEILEPYAFDREGIAQRWALFDLSSKDLAGFLLTRFPTLTERTLFNCSQNG